MAGSNRRRSSVAVRLTPAALERLRTAADAKGMTMSALVEELLPNDQYATGACRYCEKTVRQPTRRHRFHAAGCVLWADRDYRVAKAPQNA